MADYNYVTGDRASQVFAVQQGLNVKTGFVDFDASKQNLASNDTVQLVGLPSNGLALGYNAQILRAEGAVATVDIGITGALTEIATALDANALSQITVAATTAVIPASANIVLTAKAALVNAIIRVYFTVQDYPKGSDIGKF